MLIGSSASLPQELRKTDDEQLSFNYTGSVYPMQKDSLRLIPFFPPARFPLCHLLPSGERSRSRKHPSRNGTERAQGHGTCQPDSRHYFPGEQQPESDHGIRYEQAETGTNRDRHFRRAKGWFGYTLKTNKEASRLMITTRKNDPMKVVILLNNEKLTAAPQSAKRIKKVS